MFTCRGDPVEKRSYTFAGCRHPQLGHIVRNDLAVCRDTLQWIRKLCRNPASCGDILCVTAYNHVSADRETDVQMWPQMKAVSWVVNTLYLGPVCDRGSSWPAPPQALGGPVPACTTGEGWGQSLPAAWLWDSHIAWKAWCRPQLSPDALIAYLIALLNSETAV